MTCKIHVLPWVLSLLVVSSAFPQRSEYLITRLKNETRRYDDLRSRSQALTKSYQQDIHVIKRTIYAIKKELKQDHHNVRTPVYVDHDIVLDYYLNLVDFYMYEESADYYVVYARLKNKTSTHLEWVKLRYNLYLMGEFVGTDYTYIDYESYGNSGMSPYRYTYIDTYLEKMEFDSIAYEIDYDRETGFGDKLWDQILEINNIVILPSGPFYTWQGEIANNTNYSMTYPRIFAVVIKADRMISMNNTFLDVPTDRLEPYSTAVFDSYIDLPANYDDIRYYLSYALYSLQGSGNLKPNIPIFETTTFSGFARAETTFDVYLIDPNNDRMDVMADFGVNGQVTIDGDFRSGVSATVGYPYEQAGQYTVIVKAIDDEGLESAWSDEAVADISPSSVPVITTAACDTGIYGQAYSFQLEADGGLLPLIWSLTGGALPDGLALHGETGQISGMPAESGSFLFSVAVSDASFLPVSDTSDLEVFVVNHRPAITSSDTLRAFTSTQVLYVATATDPDGNAVSFDFLDYPSWLSESEAMLSGTAPDTAVHSSFKVVATDGELSDTLNVAVIIDPQTSVSSSEPVPTSYTLFQNYPNPFNPVTTLRVGVPNLAEASITILDVNGRRVHTVFHGTLQPGFHEFQWNAVTCPSGTYFVKFASRDYTKITKCVLIK